MLDLFIARGQHSGSAPQINCPPPPADPCVVLGPPAVDFQIGEEARLTANAASEDDTGVGNVIEARLSVTKKDANGAFNPYYSVTTTDSTQLGYMRDGTSLDFRFGVPGLDKGGEYQAQVAFCYDFATAPVAPYPNRFCECWSSMVSLTPASTGWAIFSPAPAKDHAGIVMPQQFEDDFRRPRTEAKNLNGVPQVGNGVSPSGFPWIDTFSQNAANGATISDAEAVELKADMALVNSEEAKGKTQYAEALIYKSSGDPGAPGNYNVDLEARLVSDATSSKAYAVKLTKGHVGLPADRVKSMLYIANTSALAALDGDTTVNIEGEKLDVAQACGNEPPLQNTGSTNDVWLRIVIENILGKANVTGWVAWGCPLDGNGQPQDISLCSNKCSKTWIDNDDSLGLLTKKGLQSVTAHEHTYRVKMIRAGSIPGS